MAEWFEGASMYALMIFFSISAIGVVMAVRTRWARLRQKNAMQDEELRKHLKNEKELMEKHKQPEPEPDPVIKPESLDDIMGDLQKDLEKDKK